MRERATHPISFQLLNKDGQPVLGIFDPQKGQTSTLELINSSRLNWKLKPLSSTAVLASNYHFELKFRPDTLSLTGTPAITVEPGPAKWKISPPVPTDGGVSFFLLSESPFELQSGTKTTLKLNNLNASGLGGGRGTRVELKWGNNLDYSNSAGPGPEVWIPGHRVQHLTLVNQRGEQNIPLHVGFAPTNQLLNNDTVNQLKLLITNALKQGSINVIPEGDAEFAATKFIISFDSSDNNWTLAPPAAVAEINIAASLEGKVLDVKRDTQGQTTQWTIRALNLPRLALNPGKSIEVTISNVKTSYLPGPTNLYLHCKNIPGYWDGDFVSVIEKGPFVFRENKVGVGTNSPAARLDVKGTTRLEGDVSIAGVPGQTNPTPSNLSISGGLRVEQGVSVGSGKNFDVDAPNVPGGRLRVTPDGDVGIGTHDPKSKLHVNGDLRLEKNKEIYFVDNGQIRSADDHHRILFRRETYNVLELREHGHIVFSSGATEGTETNKVIIRDSGKVGINTTEPQKTLHVNGDLRVENLVTVGGESDFDVDLHGAPAGRLKIKKNGAIGIGTSDPTKGKLQIEGYIGTQGSGFGYLNRKGAGSSDVTEKNNFSIWCSHRIYAEEFEAKSDERIKNIQGRSDSAADLLTLLGIEITDYSFKDVITEGNRTRKKIIGQQIESVFSQAVTKVTDVVPDIYQQASINNGWVALATDLKTGERVKLITDTGESIHEVLEATPDKFRVDFDHDADHVFVFGREVDDFLTVDYDAISMLNVSATQQLKKELDQQVTALRVENAELRAANDALARRLQLLESKLEAVLGVVSATINGSNGNGKN